MIDSTVIAVVAIVCVSTLAGLCVWRAHRAASDAAERALRWTDRLATMAGKWSDAALAINAAELDRLQMEHDTERYTAAAQATRPRPPSERVDPGPRTEEDADPPSMIASFDNGTSRLD